MTLVPGTGRAPLPTFLLLGAPRAGTTSLHHWLGGHPDVCVSRPKETQFFSLCFDKGPEYYSRFFAHWNGEPVVGESTPMYLSLPHVPRRIAALLPDAALVAVLRSPAEQAWSSWWMLRSLGVDRRSFAEVMATELRLPSLQENDAEAYWARILDAAKTGRSEPDCRLTSYFAEANDGFDALLGRDLSRWWQAPEDGRG